MSLLVSSTFPQQAFVIQKAKSLGLANDLVKTNDY